MLRRRRCFSAFCTGSYTQLPGLLVRLLLSVKAKVGQHWALVNYPAPPSPLDLKLLPKARGTDARSLFTLPHLENRSAHEHTLMHTLTHTYTHITYHTHSLTQITYTSTHSHIHNHTPSYIHVHTPIHTISHTLIHSYSYSHTFVHLSTLPHIVHLTHDPLGNHVGDLRLP